MTAFLITTLIFIWTTGYYYSKVDKLQKKLHDEIVDVVRTALGVNYSYLQTSDSDEFIKARDAIAEVVARKLTTQKDKPKKEG